ncbi:hypothetical protein E3N88_18189 [Mikania micrantha]|uniref:Uncharacterized protein n=1 Tax=Mikania micrantha TaxID=192012 RepID=A0A5N6NVS0_9ASTR|nr:hypothetical protein E3N88_18189 [Mikania micrantha]
MVYDHLQPIPTPPPPAADADKTKIDAANVLWDQLDALEQSRMAAQQSGTALTTSALKQDSHTYPRPDLTPLESGRGRGRSRGRGRGCNSSTCGRGSPHTPHFSAPTGGYYRWIPNQTPPQSSWNSQPQQWLPPKNQ